MSNYSKGAEKERQLRKQLEEQGYKVVRAAGSKGGSTNAGDHGIDLIAVGKGKMRIIQVKSTKREPKSLDAVINRYKDDILKLKALDINEADTTRELWMWVHRKGWRTFRILTMGVTEDDQLQNNS